jgi:LasA protease
MKYLHHFSPKVSALFSILVLFVITLSACGSLWGDASILSSDSYAESPTRIITNSETKETITPTKESFQNPTLIPSITPTKEIPTKTQTSVIELPNILYYSQPGDSLQAVAGHFGVKEEEIKSPTALADSGLLDPNTLLIIPSVLNTETTSPIQIMPDSEVIFSRSAIDFDVKNYVVTSGGYLNQYKEYLGSTGMTSGIECVKRLAIENSINPRMLLALLEFQSGWVRGQPSNLANFDYPLGYVDLNYVGMFRQLMLATEDLSLGYYGWRSGQLTHLAFQDGGEKIRIAPELNAGTVAILYYFSKHYNYSDWLAVVDPNSGFMKLFLDMFGDPWSRALVVEPLFPPGLTQPALSLPFYPEETWSLTGGPHSAWEKQGALAALDFGPGADQKGCYESESWVLAAASGQVVRTGVGFVILDLDNDGYEETGWDLLYLHIATRDKVTVGTLLNKDDRIGHPSCEGGPSTGTHFHIARKFNGEWVLADGPLPFNLSGWIAHAGSKPYEGSLTRGDQVVIALPNGSAVTKIVRSNGE